MLANFSGLANPEMTTNQWKISLFLRNSLEWRVILNWQPEPLALIDQLNQIELLGWTREEQFVS